MIIIFSNLIQDCYYLLKILDMISEESTSSSGEEYIHLDLELQSSDSDHHYLSSSPAFKQKRRRERNGDLKMIEEEEKQATYKILGQQNQQSTTTKRIIKSSWVSNADTFTAQIVGNDCLSSLETIVGLEPEFIKILQKFTNVWFPVQKAVLSIILNDLDVFFPARDLVICSPTGSGKTLTYVLPILNKLKMQSNVQAVYALVLAPNFNLAEQILMEFEKFNVFGANIVSLFGNNEYETERAALFPGNSNVSKAQIIIATPGRLVEHILDDRGFFNLTLLRFLVVDEADKMQDTARMEWLELVEKHANVSNANLLNLASLTDPLKNRSLQRILVSATLSLDLQKLHNWNLRCPRLFLADATKLIGEEKMEMDTKPEVQAEPIKPLLLIPNSLSHHLIQCQQKFKPYLLFREIQQNAQEWKRIIVFVNKKITSNRLAILLAKLSDELIPVAELSSNLFKKRRLALLKNFKQGKIRVLIVCDSFSRGIDVEDVDCVINYDMPINERIFAHRAGRTARGMKNGILLSLATKEEKMRIKKMLMAQELWDNVKTNADEKALKGKEMEQYQAALLHLKNNVKIKM